MSGYRMDTAAFDALAYGLPNVNTLQYLQQGIQQVQQYLTPIGQQFMAQLTKPSTCFSPT
jgi:tryptophanase